jgi:hypothetical protein
MRKRDLVDRDIDNKSDCQHTNPPGRARRSHAAEISSL